MCGFLVSLRRVTSHQSGVDLKNYLPRYLDRRGPDSRGYLRLKFKNFDIDLLHYRLSITDLSNAGDQPMTCHGVTMVFNGEIYNYNLLRDELVSYGYEFDGESDTEVLCAGLNRFGVDFISKLDGIFALFWIDHKRGKMYYCRDQFGVKPLYHSILDSGEVLLGSDCRELAIIRREPIDVRRVILETVSFGYIGGLRTPYQGIRRVESGICFELDSNVKTSFRAKVTFSNVNVVDFEGSILSQIPTLVPWGIQLSGGVDSSSLALLAIQSKFSPKCYFVDFPFSKRLSEQKNVDEMIRLGLDVEQIELNPNLFWEHFLESQKSLHSPMIDSALIPQSIISAKAKKDGLKVLWSGAGGDEVFDAYPRYRASVRPYVDKIFNYFEISSFGIKGFPGSEFGAFSRLLNPMLDMKMASIGPGVADLTVKEKEFLWEVLSVDVPKNELINFESNSVYSRADLAEYLPNLLLSQADQISMHHGIETRVPLLNSYSESVASENKAMAPVDGNYKPYLLEIIKNRGGAGLDFSRKYGFGASPQDYLLSNLPSLTNILEQSTVWSEVPEEIRKNKNSLCPDLTWAMTSILQWIELNT